MYRKILVPLDGSSLAECSLEHVKAVAIGCSVPEVILFRVVEPLSFEAVAALGAVGGDVIQAELQNQAEAKDYLTKASDKLKEAGVSSQIVVADAGNPAEEILQYAVTHKVDLIIMSTHGRSGPSQWFFGSVAERVVRHSVVPVLTIAAPGCRVGVPG